MSEQRNTAYTKKEIEKILEKIRDCIKSDKFIISQGENRQENINFINEYNLRTDGQKKILMNIKAEDFCYSSKNLNPRFKDSELYIFAPYAELYNCEGVKEKVLMYTKFNIVRKKDGNFTVVISFHRLNKLIKYAFI